MFVGTLADLPATDEDNVNPGYPDMQSISIKQDHNGLQPMGCRVPIVQPFKSFKTLPQGPPTKSRPFEDTERAESEPLDDLFAEETH